MEKASLVTMFGGSGFIGRDMAQRFARAGARIRIVTRDPATAARLEAFGDPGQIALVAGNPAADAPLATAVAGAEVVVNLVGILFEKRRQSFQSVHVEAARRIAEAAARAGASRLIQVSAIGASPEAPASYARSKAAGEAAVCEAFAGATVLRPGVVFGPQDDFFNRFANLARFSPVLPLFGGGHTRFQPVYVGDVAEAALRVARDPATRGQTFELGGPADYSFRELLEIVLRETGRRRLLLPLPFWVARLQAAFLELLPVPPLTRDQVKLLRRDTLVAAGAPGLADLGIAATAVEAVVPGYLRRFRPGGGWGGGR